MEEISKKLYDVLAAYDFPETLVGAVRYGCGHINDTYCVLCQPQEGDCVRFILQGLSSATLAARCIRSASRAAKNLRKRSSVSWKCAIGSCKVSAGKSRSRY